MFLPVKFWFFSKSKTIIIQIERIATQIRFYERSKILDFQLRSIYRIGVSVKIFLKVGGESLNLNRERHETQNKYQQS